MSAKLKKTISLVLILVTFLLLFFNWVRARNYSAAEGQSFYTNELQEQDDIAELVLFANRVTKGVAPSNMNNTMKLITRVIRFMGLQGQVGPLYNSIQASRFFFFLFFWGTIVAMLHAVFMHLFDRRYNGWGVTIGLILMYFVFIAFRNQIQVLAINPIRFTIWPYVAMIAMIASSVFWSAYVHQVGANTGSFNITRDTWRGFAESAKQKGKSGAASVKQFVENIDIAPKSDWDCASCGTHVEKKYDYCPNCGAPRVEPQRCQYCGASVPEGARFCGKCGKPYAPAAQGNSEGK